MFDFENLMKKAEEVRRKEKAVQTLRERATDTSVRITDMPHGGGTQDKMGAYVASIADMLEELRKAERELKTMRRSLSREMGILKVWQEKDMIKKVYIEGKTIQIAADEIGYEYRQAWRYLEQGRTLINTR